MKTLACDRCLKIKTDGDYFANVIVDRIPYDLCEECYENFKKLSLPYEMAIDGIEVVLQRVQRGYINERREQAKSDNNK